MRKKIGTKSNFDFNFVRSWRKKIRFPSNQEAAMSSTTDAILEKETVGCYVKARYVLTLMMALGLVNTAFLRNGMSIAILKMVKTNPNSTAVANMTYRSECPAESRNASEVKHNIGEFDWTISQQTTLLGCYFYGYMLMNIPGALLVKSFGIRTITGISVLLSAVLTLLTPACAKQGFGLLVANRSIIGFLDGILLTSVMTGMSHWAPPAERSRLLSIVFGAGSLGIALIFPLAGIIESMLHWEAIFFVTGGAGLLWSVLWLALIHDSPATHPRISENERKYIEESIGTKQADKKKKVPWLKICTSPPVFGAIAAQLGIFWMNSTIVNLGPMYLAHVLHFDVKTAGFLSSLPFFLRFFTALVWGFIADWMIATKFIPLLWVRKFSSFFPSAVSGLSIIAVAYLGCNKWPAVVCLSATCGFIGMSSSGYRSTFIDIAPVYSGIIFSVSNTLSAAVRFLAPQVSGILLVDQTLNSWRNVFWLAAAISFAGGIVYVLLASSEVQDWARDPITAEVGELTPLNGDEKEVSCDEQK